MSLMNLLLSSLSYEDQSATDNPSQRSFDYTRKLSAIVTDNPESDSGVVPPMGSRQLFSGVVPTLLSGSSVLSLSLLSAQDSIYRLEVTSGPAGFRTARSVSGVTTAVVAINNNALATFTFAGATLTAVQPGDVMRIRGAKLYDTAPYAFSPLNAGLWNVLSVVGDTVTVARPVGELFSGANESVSVATADVSFYSADGVQPGQAFELSGVVSPASRGTYSVRDATPNYIDFVSGQPLPEETGLTYVTGALTIYSNAKRWIYLEVDQDSSLRLNGDTTDQNRVQPIVAGDPALVGFFMKWGLVSSATLVNKSQNPLRYRYFSAE